MCGIFHSKCFADFSKLAEFCFMQKLGQFPKFSKICLIVPICCMLSFSWSIPCVTRYKNGCRHLVSFIQQREKGKPKFWKQWAGIEPRSQGSWASLMTTTPPGSWLQESNNFKNRLCYPHKYTKLTVNMLTDVLLIANHFFPLHLEVRAISV